MVSSLIRIQKFVWLWIAVFGCFRSASVVVVVDAFSVVLRQPSSSRLRRGGNGNPGLLFATSTSIDFQSAFGRGEHHLSALLEEGDVVVYQTGTWLVDGVEVGDGTEPQFHLCRIDTLQVVWTHNCEHGVLRGLQVERRTNDGSEEHDYHPTKLITTGTTTGTLIDVEFGPEQLVARLPVTWNDDDDDEGISAVPLENILWQDHGMV
jgi:hypothetical protein